MAEAEASRRQPPVASVPGTGPPAAVAFSPTADAWIIRTRAAAVEVLRQASLSAAIYSAARPSPLPLLSSFELSDEDGRRFRHTVWSCLSEQRLPRHVLVRGCRQVADTIPAGRAFDAVSCWAEPTARALLREQFTLDAARLGRLLGLFVFAAAEPGSAVAQAADKLIMGELAELIERRRRDPEDDLISPLAVAWGEEGHDDRWLVAFVAPMFHAAAHGFGARLLTHTVYLLAEHEDIQQRIRAEGAPAACDAVREAGRLYPVNQVVLRQATEPVLVGGCPVQPGDRLLIDLPAVCRDAQAHPAPHDFRPARRGPQSLAFGLGAHACGGRDLAVLSAAFALTEVLGRRALVLAPAPGGRARWQPGLGPSCLELPLLARRVAADAG